MKRIVLHIGYGKTGTTAIQGALATNRQLLADEGILYPEWRDFVERDNHNGVAKCLTYREHEGFLPSFFDGLHKSAANTIVISGETLAIYPERGAFARSQKSMVDGSVFQNGYRADPNWRIKKRDLIGELKSSLPDADEVRVVVFLRRQDLWLESVYNEDVKGGYSAADFGSFGEYYKNSLHYDQQLELWADAFGHQSIDVRVYEKDQLEGGVVQQFFQAGGLGGKGGDVNALVAKLAQPANATPNPRLSVEALAARRKMNARIAWLPEALWLRANSWVRKRADAISAKAGKDALFSRQQLMTESERAIFLEQFQIGNERVARNFLAREDGVLFRDSL
jgi:hypothetical protein